MMLGYAQRCSGLQLVVLKHSRFVNRSDKATKHQHRTWRVCGGSKMLETCKEL